MRRAHVGWRGFIVVMLLALLVPLGTIPVGQEALAQGMAFDCPAPAASASTQQTGGGTSAVQLVAPDATFPDAGGALTVFAAASLTDAFGEVKTDLEAAHAGLTITYNFASSQALVTQLNAGARADVFASANVPQMQAAIDNGSISGEPITFANNRLAIVIPADNPADMHAPGDLGRPGLRLVLAQPEVPAGRYSRQAICALGADPDAYGADFVERVTANIVSQEEDVRAVLAKVQLGEADAGIVYASDAAIAGGTVSLIEIPDAENVMADYPIAAVAEGNPALAEAFIAYLLSPEGQATLEAFGFTPVGD